MPSPSPQAMPSLSTPSPQVSIGHAQHPNPAQMLSILNSNLNNPSHSHLSNSNPGSNAFVKAQLNLYYQPTIPVAYCSNLTIHFTSLKVILSREKRTGDLTPIGVRLPQLPRTLPQATPQALPTVTRDDDDIATIIKLEDKSPPTPLVDANDKFAKYQTVSNQVRRQK